MSVVTMDLPGVGCAAGDKPMGRKQANQKLPLADYREVEWLIGAWLRWGDEGAGVGRPLTVSHVCTLLLAYSGVERLAAFRKERARRLDFPDRNDTADAIMDFKKCLRLTPDEFGFDLTADEVKAAAGKMVSFNGGAERWKEVIADVARGYPSLIPGQVHRQMWVAELFARLVRPSVEKLVRATAKDRARVRPRVTSFEQLVWETLGWWEPPPELAELVRLDPIKAAQADNRGRRLR